MENKNQPIVDTGSNESEKSDTIIAHSFIKTTPLCATSHKEVAQFYSPAASDIASSGIRLTPSDICYASFMANKISRKP